MWTVCRPYHFDALGSTRLLTNSSGAVTDTYGYDAWGGASQGGSTVQPYQFVGQLGYYFPVQDENFPLLQLGVRFYDPAQTGRFTQRDAVRMHSRSAHTYCASRPTLYVDPSGLYGVRGDCATRCPHLDEWITEINWRMFANSRCRQAIEDVGCAGFIKPGLTGITITCKSLPYEGQCISSGEIELDCSHRSTDPGTVLHEAIHACFDKSKRPYHPFPWPWKCPKCPRRWGIDEEPDPEWEWAADKVRHACGF